MVITIDTHMATKEDIAKLIKYLESQDWDYRKDSNELNSKNRTK